METDKAKKRIKAQKTVEQLKRFYKHAFFYILVNLFFIGRRIYKDIDRGDPFLEAFTDVSNYRLFFWWTIFLIFHAFKVYGTRFFFSKEWEEKEIRKQMNK